MQNTLGTYFSEAELPSIPDWAYSIPIEINGRRDLRPTPKQIIEGLNHLAAHLPRAALWWEPGTGKTLPLLALSVWLVSLGNKVVYITLPKLVPQVVDSCLSLFTGIDKHISVAGFQGTQPQRQKLIETWGNTSWPDILVLGYPAFGGPSIPSAKRYKDRETYYSVLKEISYLPGEPLTAKNFKGRALADIGYSLCIADEGHRLKNPTCMAATETQEFLGQDNGIIIATGSPLETHVEDTYGLIKILTPEKYTSRNQFDYMHCVYRDFQKKIPSSGKTVSFSKIVEYRNLAMLKSNLYSRATRVLQTEVFTSMPELILEDYKIDLEASHLKAYKSANEEGYVELEDEGDVMDLSEDNSLYTKLQRGILNPATFGLKCDSAVLETMSDIVESLEGQKIVVAAWFQDSIALIQNYFKALNPVVINGEVSASQAEQNKQTFINDPNCRMIVLNFKSGGVGLDGMQHVSNNLIFAEICPWPTVWAQVVARLRRPGQTKPVNVHTMVASKTIAVKLRNALLKSDAVNNLVVGDNRPLISELY